MTQPRDSTAPQHGARAPRSTLPQVATPFGLPPVVRAVGGEKPLPFLPLAPVIVVVLSLAAALAILLAGLDHLGRVSDEHAAAKADLLARTMVARLATLPKHERADALRLAARRTGAELLVVSPRADLLLDASLGAPDPQALRRVLERQRGEAVTALGRTRFTVEPFEGGSAYLVAFTRMPSAPEAAPALGKALVALTTLLVGVAAMVAYAVARDGQRELAFVTQRVAAMVKVRTEPTGEPVPVRTVDEVGALTSAFNELVGRFAEAERGYLEDLDRVKNADRDRAAFLAAVSHELRSPLNAILGFADILMAEVDGPLPEDSREEVAQIRESGQHLLALISDILELSAIESGQLKLSRTKVDVGALVTEVMREAAGMIGSKRIQLRVDVPPGLEVHADPRRLRQILTNLVGNAVKFTQRGEVAVLVTKEQGRARISVRDTGPGISAVERANLFQEYRQAEAGRRHRRGGTGLGLAIARRLAFMHGGTIQLESEVGKGSTFHIYMPLYVEGRTRTIESASRTSAAGLALGSGGDDP